MPLVLLNRSQPILQLTSSLKGRSKVSSGSLQLKVKDDVLPLHLLHLFFHSLLPQASQLLDVKESQTNLPLQKVCTLIIRLQGQWRCLLISIAWFLLPKATLELYSFQPGTSTWFLLDCSLPVSTVGF